jgi:hypothetical protein
MREHETPVQCLARCIPVCLLLLSGCSSSLLRVDSDYGPAIKMSGCLGPYFAWRPDFEASFGEPASPYYQVRAFIRDTIQAGFEERGFSRSTPDSAGFWIDFGLCTRSQGDPYDQFIQYEMGTLVLQVIDPVSRQRIWRVWAETRVRKSITPEERRERIRRTVQQMMKRFPYEPLWMQETVVEEPASPVEPVPSTVPAPP